MEHERLKYGLSCLFVTLDYAPEHLPFGGVLVPEHWTAFMKRLRKEVAPLELKFLACGEYGGRTGRPHFHAVIFGWWPPDSKAWKKSGEQQLYRSATLEKLWPYGFSLFGRVTESTGAYVAKYTCKGQEVDDWPRTQPVTRYCPWMLDLRTGRMGPLVDPATGRIVEWVPPFIRVSRRPGLGYAWFAKYGDHAISMGSLTGRGGAKRAIPRYYEKLADRRAVRDGDVREGEHAPEIVRLKDRRAEHAQSDQYRRDNTPHMLRMRNACKVARHKQNGGADKL